MLVDYIRYICHEIKRKIPNWSCCFFKSKKPNFSSYMYDYFEKGRHHSILFHFSVYMVMTNKTDRQTKLILENKYST